MELFGCDGKKYENVLTEKDLHCLARILQGSNYMDGDIFGCCKYCLYQEECNKDVKEGKLYFTQVVTQKLQDVTGVYLGINTHNIKEKLLINSFQFTSRGESMQ